MREILKETLEYGKKYIGKGKISDYIPELSKADSKHCAICVVTKDNEQFYYGDYNQKFSIQSISKVISLILAIEDLGVEGVFTKVGMEPTGDMFNSLVRLDNIDNIKPFNPMINAGAIAVATCISGKDVNDRFQRYLKLTRKLCNNPEIDFSKEIYLCEKEHGNKNRAIAYLMQSNGTIVGNIEEHLDLYFKMCSLMVTCKDIAYLAAVLSNNGCDPDTGECYIPLRALRIVRSLMATCGMYDASGEFATKVGIPSKSGVGGGIISVVPNAIGVGVFGPALDEKGNSIMGIKMLEYLSAKQNLSIF